MMRTRIRTLIASALLFALFPWSANAIPFGVADDGEYPYVGLATFGSNFGSGVLISPGVVLTAAHVAELFQAGSSEFITGSNALDPEAVVNISSAVVHPDYDPSGVGPLFDYGLLFLEEAITIPEYATLWPADTASLVGQLFEAVGYGNTARRRVGTSTILDVGGNLLTSPSVTEAGDSGGGMFVEIDGSNVLTGLVSFGNSVTSSFVSVSHARSFIDQYVPDARWFGESVVTEPPLPVPEPSMLPMLATGLFAFAAIRSRLRRRSRVGEAAKAALAA